MLRKADRLTTQEVTALSQGKSVFGTLLSLRFIPAEKSKFAVPVSKKVSVRAVDRNTLRRKVYDALGFLHGGLVKPVFVMVLPKKDCLSASVDAIKADIEVTFKKAGLM